MHILIIIVLLQTTLQTNDFPNCKSPDYKNNFLSSVEIYNKNLICKFPDRSNSKKDVFVSSSFLFYEQLLLVSIPLEEKQGTADVFNFLLLPHDENNIDCYIGAATLFQNHIKDQKIKHKGLVYINPNVEPNQEEKNTIYHVNSKIKSLFSVIAETIECDLSEKKTELENKIKYETHNMLSIDTIEGMVTDRTFSIYIILLGLHFTLNQYPDTPLFKPAKVEYKKANSEKVEKDVLEAKDEFYVYKDDLFFVVFVDIYIKVNNNSISVNEKTKMIFVAKHEHLHDKSKEHFLKHLGNLDFKYIYKMCLNKSNKQCVKNRMDLKIPVINELYVKDFYNDIMTNSNMGSLFHAYPFVNYVEGRKIMLVSDGVGIITKMFLNKEGESKMALLSMEASDFKLNEVIPEGYAHSMFISVYDTDLGVSYLDLLMYKDHGLTGPRLILDMNENYLDKLGKHKHLMFLLVISFVTFIVIVYLIIKKKDRGVRKSIRNRLNERKSLLISDRNEDAFL